MRQRFLPLALTIGAILAACNSLSEERPGPKQPAPGERDVATLAIDALAKDLGIAQEKIQVDTIRAVDWPDSSLGCPQPGRAYLQVVTPGHKVTLRAEGRIHVVHEAKNRAFVCEQTKPYAGINPKQELVFGRQLLDARSDLASRIGVPESEIKPKAAQERTWENAGLDCPEPGKSYPPGKVTGWVLTLEHRGRDYTYHTDLHSTIPCPAITGQ